VRCLGIDHGERRWGLAFGDDLGVATPLPALTGRDPAGRWSALASLVGERRVTDLVLGHPLNMDGSEGPKAAEANAFAGRLRAAFKLPVHLVDERLTSCEAEASIPKARRRDLRRSGIVDSRAAAILLQDFLDQRRNLP
jgi:putative Holliday junction resolvase